MQMVIKVAYRAEIPFTDMIDDYRNDLIDRNRHAREVRNSPEYSDYSDFDTFWPFYNHHTLKVLEVKEGYGTHLHDNECEYGKNDPRVFRDTHKRPCTMHYEDSDWIVTLSYRPVNSDKEHWAQFGVVNGRYNLWAD